METKTILTGLPYYSVESNKKFMSVSQFKGFIQCEAREMAKLNGWKEEEAEALKVGTAVHEHFEGADTWKDDPFFTKKLKGELVSNAKGKMVEDLIQALDSNEFFASSYQLEGNEMEVEVFGEIFGCQWKGKIDSLDVVNNVFHDIKTTRDFRKGVWNDEARKYEPFFIAYGYDIQMAIYTLLLKMNYGENFQHVFHCVSKTAPYETRSFFLDPETLKKALKKVEEKLPHILEVKQGKIPPRRCENCAYCKETYDTKQILTEKEMWNLMD